MKVLCAAVVVLLSAVFTDALKCYECKETISGDKPELPAIACRDAFIPESSGSTPNDIKQTTCSQDQMSCYKTISDTYTLNINGKFISSYIISRGCLNTTKTINECDEGKSAQGYQAVCLCSDSLCNSATLSYVSAFTLSACLLFAVFKLH
jgi:hypothetical protein